MITWTFIMIAAAMCFSPGPNNLLLTASGMNVGIRHSQPHVFGTISGFFFLLVVSGLGLIVLVESYPWVDIAIKILGCVFLFYLSYRITVSEPEEADNGTQKTKGLTFSQAFVFQFINPKGVLIALSVQGNFFPAEPTPIDILILSAVFAFVIGLSSAQTYVLLGCFIGNRVKNPKTQKAISHFMGILLGLTTVYLFVENLGSWFWGMLRTLLAGI